MVTRKSAQLAVLGSSESDSEDVGTALGRRRVTMGNALANAGHGLSLSEKRIVAMGLAQIDSRGSRWQANTAVPHSRIEATEYAALYNVDLNTAYEQLKDAGLRLLKRQVTFFTPSTKRKKDGTLLGAKYGTVTVSHWLGHCDYHDKEGWLEMGWHYKLMPQLLMLYRNFTTYQLANGRALRSSYSWRLMELMEKHSSGWMEIDIEDFSLSMDATENQKSNFANIRRKIIEPAVKELVEGGDWLIEWRPLKKGRKVTALRFVFKRNPQSNLFT
jgi:plasmid replication initiation protein